MHPGIFAYLVFKMGVSYIDVYINVLQELKDNKSYIGSFQVSSSSFQELQLSPKQLFHLLQHFPINTPCKGIKCDNLYSLHYFSYKIYTHYIHAQWADIECRTAHGQVAECLSGFCVRAETSQSY